jgi:hypothetical protein
MSKVAATASGGSLRISSAVLLNVPQDVGKSAASMSALIERVSVLFLGYDRSCIRRNLSECGFGTRPSGEVLKGPMANPNSVGEYARE